MRDGQREQLRPCPEPVLERGRVLHPHHGAVVDAADGADHSTAADDDGDVDRPGWACAQVLARNHEQLDLGHDAVDDPAAELAGRQGLSSPLGLDARQGVGTSQPRPQPVADRPAAQRVQLDGERVVEFLVVADQRDAEPLPQERLARVFEERDQVVERELIGLVGWVERRVEEPAGARRDCPARTAPASDCRSKLNGAHPHRVLRHEAARVERLQWMVDDDVRSCWRPSDVRTSASAASRISPMGTAGGRGAFVRGSAPV